MMIGLGVGIDYALFILARHRQNLESGMPVPEAIGRANATAGLSVLFAGITVVVAIAGLQVSGIPMMTMMGWASALMVADRHGRRRSPCCPPCSASPARGSTASGCPFIKQKPAYNPRRSRPAGRPGSSPSRSATALVAAVLLGDPRRSRCSPCGSASPTPATTRRTRTTRKAYDLIADGYGPGVNGPLAGRGRHPTARPTAAAVVADLAEGTRRRPGRRLGRRADLHAEEGPGDHQRRRRPRRRRTRRPRSCSTGCVTTSSLRRRRAPTSRRPSPARTALVDDISSRLQQRMPYFLGAVIGLSFLVLMLVFRSVLVPLKAALLNVLSVGCGVRRRRRGLPVGLGRRA